MLYCIQRNSNRNYAMRAFCLDSPCPGARFVTYKAKRVMRRTAVWLTRSNLNDHATDDSIVDASHAAMFFPNKAKQRTEILLTADNLIGSCNPRTQCIFVNCFAARGSGFVCEGHSK